MNIKHVIWARNPNKGIMGDLIIKDGEITFIQDHTDYSKQGGYYSAKPNGEWLSRLFKKIFKSGKEKITKDNGGFNLDIASLKDVSVTSAPSKVNVGSYSMTIKFTHDEKQYTLNKGTKEENLYKEIEAQLVK